MDLSSLRFLFLFLPVFLVIYLLSTPRFKLPIILVASIVFLAWGQRTAIYWLSGIIIFGYFMGLVVERTKEKGRQALLWLWVGIGINLVILSFFKLVTAHGE